MNDTLTDVEKLEYVHSTLQEFWDVDEYADMIDNSLMIIEELRERLFK